MANNSQNPNAERGITLCGAITELLNDIIATNGTIEKDNPRIWDELLHVLDNQDWADIFAGFKTKLKNSDVFLTDSQERKFLQAQSVFQKDHHNLDRCMDIRSKTKNNKPHAWAMIMVIREVFNEINNTKVTPKPKNKKNKVTIEQTDEYIRTTVYFNLFDEE